jgi:hypothetical protein
LRAREAAENRVPERLKTTPNNCLFPIAYGASFSLYDAYISCHKTWCDSEEISAPNRDIADGRGRPPNNINNDTCDTACCV